MASLIDKIRQKIPVAGSPDADLSVEDFEDFDPHGGNGDGDDEEESQGDDEEQEGENGDGQQQEEESGENGNNEEGEESQENGENDQEDEEGKGSDKDGDNENESSEGEQNSRENSPLDEDERQDLKEDMEDSSAERDMSDWFEVDENYEEPSKFVKRYYEQLQDARSDPETQLEQRKRDRDEREQSQSVSVRHQEVLQEYNKRFADEITEAFRKIKTRSAPKPSEHGQRVNMRGVVRRRSGDMAEERLYLEMEPSEVGDRCVTVVVDGSGSMDELEVKLALYALSDATEQIGDNFAATTYDTESSAMFASNYNPRTHLITGPTEQFKPENLDTFNANGLTPTASGIADGRSLTEITPNSEDVIIVITDGLANITEDGTACDDDNIHNRAMEQASEQFSAAINNGKRVIGVGVGEYLEDDAMHKIFGNNYVKTEMDGIADALIDIYQKQMETDAS
jgi:Mg-chelatase subunit ChlD